MLIFCVLRACRQAVCSVSMLSTPRVAARKHSEKPPRETQIVSSHKHAVYCVPTLLFMNRPEVEFGTKFGQMYGVSSSSCFVHTWVKLKVSFGMQVTRLTLKPHHHTLLQRPVWNDSCIGLHCAWGDILLCNAWWLFTVKVLNVVAVVVRAEPKFHHPPQRGW